MVSTHTSKTSLVGVRLPHHLILMIPEGISPGVALKYCLGLVVKNARAGVPEIWDNCPGFSGSLETEKVTLDLPKDLLALLPQGVGRADALKAALQLHFKGKGKPKTLKVSGEKRPLGRPACTTDEARLAKRLPPRRLE